MSLRSRTSLRHCKVIYGFHRVQCTGLRINRLKQCFEGFFGSLQPYKAFRIKQRLHLNRSYYFPFFGAWGSKAFGLRALGLNRDRRFAIRYLQEVSMELYTLNP